MGACSGKQKKKHFRGEPFEKSKTKDLKKKKSNSSKKYGLKCEHSLKSVDDKNQKGHFKCERGETETKKRTLLTPVQSAQRKGGRELETEDNTTVNTDLETGTLPVPSTQRKEPEETETKDKTPVDTDVNTGTLSISLAHGKGSETETKEKIITVNSTFDNQSLSAPIAHSEDFIEGLISSKKISSQEITKKSVSNGASKKNNSSSKTEFGSEDHAALPNIPKPYNFANGYSEPPKEDKLKSDQPCQKDSSDDTNAQTQQSTLECCRSGSGQKESQLSHDANLTSILQPSSQQPTYDSHQGLNRLSNMHPTDELSSSTQSCKQQKSKEISNVENGKRSEDIDPTNKQCSSINNSKQHYPQSTKEISPGENVNHSSDTKLPNQADQVDLDPIPAGNQTGYDQSKCAYPLGDVKDLNRTPESTPSKKSPEDINAHASTKKTTGVSDEQASTKKTQKINIRISNNKSSKKKNKKKSDPPPRVVNNFSIPEHITGASVVNFGCNFTSTSKQKINISDPKDGRIEVLNFACENEGQTETNITHTMPTELPTPVMDANVIKLLAQAIDSIGIIKTETPQGTCWRVGTNLILTAFHVVRNIVVAYTTGTDRKNIEFLNEMKLKTVRITFGRTTDTDSKDDTKVFEVEPSILYHNESLDTAILRLKPNGKHDFPPPFRNFHNLVPERDEKEEVYLIGHQKESQEINFKVGIWNPTDERMKSLEKFCEDNINKGYEYVGYSELDNSDRIVVKCEFRHGASGCPGFVIVVDKLYVVTAFLRGFPDFFYAKTFESKRANFPKDKLFQQGVKIGAIKSHLEKHNRKLYDDIFQDQMNKEESNHRNQMVVSGGHMISPTNVTNTGQPVSDGHPDMIQRQTSQMAVTGREKNIPFQNVIGDK